mmetsp:Transcript_8779/g.15423  ORF Transcript_8779/g.15423 Transcript_8779/m.15423 type:complete len:201 (-) Transcript_8779:1352-1954(-)
MMMMMSPKTTTMSQTRRNHWKTNVPDVHHDPSPCPSPTHHPAFRHHHRPPSSPPDPCSSSQNRQTRPPSTPELRDPPLANPKPRARGAAFPHDAISLRQWRVSKILLLLHRHCHFRPVPNAVVVVLARAVAAIRVYCACSWEGHHLHHLLLHHHRGHNSQHPPSQTPVLYSGDSHEEEASHTPPALFPSSDQPRQYSNES